METMINLLRHLLKHPAYKLVGGAANDVADGNIYYNHKDIINYGIKLSIASKRLFNVIPRLITFYCTNNASRYFKKLNNLFIPYTHLKKKAYPLYLEIIQFCRMVIFSSFSLTSTLCPAVSNIFASRANKKMFWVKTRGIITLMANKHRALQMKSFPKIRTYPSDSARLIINRYFPIPIFVFFPRPFPTRGSQKSMISCGISVCKKMRFNIIQILKRELKNIILSSNKRISMTFQTDIMQSAKTFCTKFSSASIYRASPLMYSLSRVHLTQACPFPRNWARGFAVSPLQ